MFEKVFKQISIFEENKKTRDYFLADLQKETHQFLGNKLTDSLINNIKKEIRNLVLNYYNTRDTHNNISEELINDSIDKLNVVQEGNLLEIRLLDHLLALLWPISEGEQELQRLFIISNRIICQYCKEKSIKYDPEVEYVCNYCMTSLEKYMAYEVYYKDNTGNGYEI